MNDDRVTAIRIEYARAATVAIHQLEFPDSCGFEWNTGPGPHNAHRCAESGEHMPHHCACGACVGPAADGPVFGSVYDP